MPDRSQGALHSYRPIAEIGRGGMARVVLAVARGPAGWSKLVVVKTPREDAPCDADATTMFLHEARLAARMNHPNVVQTLEFGRDEGRYFFVMEYLDGQSYARALRRLRRRMPLEMHVRVVADALAGLHHAHELRDFDGSPLDVVHRDVSPQNVFVTYAGSIKVVDFGIAKCAHPGVETGAGRLRGKIHYMSPEQARGEPLDRRTDVFSAGVLLWEAMAGRRMWVDRPDLTVIHELVADRVPDLRAAAPDAPRALVAIVERALAPARERRHPTARALAAELEDWLANHARRATARHVGDLVAHAFDAERRRVQAVVDEGSLDLRWGDLPAFDATPADELPLDDAGAAPTPAAPEPEPGPGAPTDPPHAPRRARRVAVTVAGVALAATLLATAALLARDDREARGASPPASASSAASATAGPEQAPRDVRVVIHVDPDHARVYVDGTLVSTGSFAGTFPASRTLHAIRVEADGRRTAEDRMTFTSDTVARFALEPVTTGPPRGGPPATGSTRRRRATIDTANPY